MTVKMLKKLKNSKNKNRMLKQIFKQYVKFINDFILEIETNVNKIGSFLSNKYNSIIIHLLENKNKLNSLLEFLKDYECIINEYQNVDALDEMLQLRIQILKKKIEILKSQVNLLVRMCDLKVNSQKVEN